jgi:hypothetical protein
MNKTLKALLLIATSIKKHAQQSDIVANVCNTSFIDDLLNEFKPFEWHETMLILLNFLNDTCDSNERINAMIETIATSRNNAIKTTITKDINETNIDNDTTTTTTNNDENFDQTLKKQTQRIVIIRDKEGRKAAFRVKSVVN